MICAISNFGTQERFERFTMIKCILETGRTHQIRVHMAGIGHPVAGDTVYGNGAKTPVDTNGQALHAHVLGFTHPRTGEHVETVAPIPEYFNNFIMAIR